MIDKKQLCEFLIKAKKLTYAASDKAEKIIENDKSISLFFVEGDWKYHDNYFGSNYFGGREIVFFKNNPVYIMTYYGRGEKELSDMKLAYVFLRKALSLIPEDKPFRGPKELNDGNFSYVNNFTGEVDNFFGEEIITELGKEIYRARYAGGFIN
jgi:hypothetical protein